MGVVYREDIGFNGVLIVEDDNFYIQYKFLGPDSRYNGATVIIKGEEVDDYIKAWELNFEEYLSLRRIHKGKRLEQKSLKGMNIKVGEFWEGVCLTGNHLPINNRRKLKKVIDTLIYAKEKANS